MAGPNCWLTSTEGLARLGSRNDATINEFSSGIDMLTAWICRMGRFVALVLAPLALASPAFGSAFSTDNSDIYNATNESGWAVELTQQGDVVFATIYTHDANNHPVYYSAALLFAGTNASGNAVWTGDLIETQGPWFGAPFDASKVVKRKGRDDHLRSTIRRGGSAYFQRRRRHRHEADHSVHVPAGQLRRRLPRRVQAGRIGLLEPGEQRDLLFRRNVRRDPVDECAQHRRERFTRRKLHIPGRLFAVRPIRPVDGFVYVRKRCQGWPPRCSK